MRKIAFSVLKALIIILIVVCLLGVSVFLIELKKANGDTKRAAVNVARKVADTVVNEEPIYLLFLGYSADEGTTLTDTIIYMGYNPKNQQAFMISIPRDTFVGKDSKNVTGNAKINSLYTKGNATKTMKAVKNILGDVQIDYFVTINTKVLIQIVDILGGVEFDVPIDMNYDDKTQNLHIHLKSGIQKLDGKKAEQLLRFRHNNNGTSYDSEYGDNDYGRMRTQREFIVSIFKQALEVNDIDKLKEIISAVFKNLETDCSLTTIFSYLTYVYDLDTENLQMEQLPGESVRKGENSIWVFEPDKQAARLKMKEILDKFNNNEEN